MGYRNLRQCIDDLTATGQMVQITEPVDPCLEAAEIQRRVFAAQGPALYFANVKGSRFGMVSNLFGTMPRLRVSVPRRGGGFAAADGVRIDPSDACAARGCT